MLTHIVMLASAAGFLVGDDRVSKASSALAQPYWDCVVHYANLLETSNGSGEEIAIAAKHVCKDHGDKLKTSIDWDMIQAGLNGNTKASRTSEQIMAPIEEELRREVIFNVLVKRAKRNDDAALQTGQR